MIHPCSVDASPFGTYFCVLREGEKISGRDRVGLGGEVGWGGRMKAGRCGAGVLNPVEEKGVVSFLRAVNNAGVRGGGTMKRWVLLLCGASGVVNSRGWTDELWDRRRRLLRSSVTKRFSSSPSSSPVSCSVGARSSNVRSRSTVCSMPKPLSSLGGALERGCEVTPMLSIRSNFRLGFGRGVNCVCDST